MQVDQYVEVEILEGRNERVMSARKGYLGVGHDDVGPIFGEVDVVVVPEPDPAAQQSAAQQALRTVREAHGTRLDAHARFTHRCYRLDEHLDRRRMAERGLLLDAGTTCDRVYVEGEQVGAALSQLRQPLATLHVGDAVEVKRNLDHPAWKKQVVDDHDHLDSDGGTRWVRDPEVEEDLFAGTLSEVDAARGRVRVGQNGFWYDSEHGKQENSEATYVVSAQPLLARAAEGRAVESRFADQADALGEPAVDHRVLYARDFDRFSDQFRDLTQRVGEWNPHSPTMAPRIAAFHTSFGRLEDATKELAESVQAEDYIGARAKLEPLSQWVGSRLAELEAPHEAAAARLRANGQVEPALSPESDLEQDL